MKKFLLSLTLFAVLLSCFAASADAKDMSRRFGIGVDSSISRYDGDGRGLSIVYHINRYFGLQAIFGLNVLTAKIDAEDSGRGDLNTTITNWNVSVRGLIPFVVTSDVNLNASVGFTANGRASDGFSSTNEAHLIYNDGYNFSIDLGIRPEWFINDHFSIHTQVGIGITFLTKSGSAVVPGFTNKDPTVTLTTKASGASMDFFKNADLLGMAGFTFWF
ncbi:MAG: porin family protein [Proteobacteria bacterium]|nr:porin family protein [Pseudomonadota bacterium]